MSRFFIHRPVFAGVIAIIIVLAGIVAAKLLAVAQYPEIAPPTVLITTTYPGASAETLFLSNYASINVVDELKRIPGVADVTVFGARDYSMRVWINPEKMARLGV